MLGMIDKAFGGEGRIAAIAARDLARPPIQISPRVA